MFFTKVVSYVISGLIYLFLFKLGGQMRAEGLGEFGFEMLPVGSVLCGIAEAHYLRPGTPAPILGLSRIRHISSPQGPLSLWC